MADFVVTPANVLASSQALTLIGTAANAIVAGDVLCFNVSGLLTQADSNVVANSVIKGIALQGALTGQPCLYVVRDPKFTPGFSSTIGVTVIASANAGKMCPDADKASGWFVTELGHFFSTSQMILALMPVGVAIP